MIRPSDRSYGNVPSGSILPAIKFSVILDDLESSCWLTAIHVALIFISTGEAHMVADVYARIGSEIRQRREGLGLSQAQLAEKIGVGRTSITMMERGAQAILVHQLLSIARALKIPPGKLVEGVDVCEPPGPSRELFQTAEIMELLSGLERSIGRITR